MVRRSVLGLLAHVDAGKTTLIEALLYESGAIRTFGRVDHGDAFLDTDPLERERGVTIEAKTALLRIGDRELTLLDTPGHAGLSAETERALSAMDHALLIVSAAEGPQGRTRALWELLERCGIPTVVFLNKTDRADPGPAFEACRRELSGDCVLFDGPPESWQEDAALCDEAVMGRFLETGTVSDGDVRSMTARRALFPVFTGSALGRIGIRALLDGLARSLPDPPRPEAFGGRIFKISRDAKGERLAWMKVTGGVLRPRQLLRLRHADGSETEEKAGQVLLCSGTKRTPLDEAPAGGAYAVTGLSGARAGDSVGTEGPWEGPVQDPPIRVQILPRDGTDPHTLLARLRELAEEDPSLRPEGDGDRIQVRVLGEVQEEVLQRRLADRFGIAVGVGPGGVAYRETIAAPVTGIGHFEPLRHYAEVWLRLDPLPSGSGIEIGSDCPEDELAGRWQRLILSMLGEKEHKGVLTGAPLTDVRISLTAGRAHPKHTEGGDFREAAWRAVRQGLMGAENVLLEPWWAFRLTVPADRAGRAMADLQRMGGDVPAPQIRDGEAVLEGEAPVAELMGYAAQVTAYTAGQGRLDLRPALWRPCRDQAGIVAASGYDPEADLDDPSASVFCSHGAGSIVPWYEVPERAHLRPEIRGTSPDAPPAPPVRTGASPSRTDTSPSWTGSFAEGVERERELQAIFQRTYGPPRPRRQAVVRDAPARPRTPLPVPAGPVYLLVDGYNIVFAWDELAAVARQDLDAARVLLCDLLCGYQSVRGCEVIVVFDAYRVRGNPGSHEKYHTIHVVYTREAETADSFIERASYELTKEHRVRVATSDGPEQLIILGHGAERVSASMFHEEMREVRERIDEALERYGRRERTGAVADAFRRAMDPS